MHAIEDYKHAFPLLVRAARVQQTDRVSIDRIELTAALEYIAKLEEFAIEGTPATRCRICRQVRDYEEEIRDDDTCVECGGVYS